MLFEKLARACAAGAALVAAPCVAQTADTDPFHWAYAPALGGGVYRLGDGTEARTYRGNFSVPLRAATSDRAGIKLLLPVAVGVQNLDDADLPVNRPSDKLEHAAFLPGVGLEHLVGERVALRTQLNIGRAKELEGEERSARLAAVGLRSRVTFADAPGKPSLLNGILWTTFDMSTGEQRALLRLTAAVEFDVRAARWRVRDSPMHWRPHVLKDWYYRPPPALAYHDDGFEQLDDEWQVGVSAVREDGFKILFLRFDGVGIAYRFSDHSTGLRFYLNSVF